MCAYTVTVQSYRSRTLLKAPEIGYSPNALAAPKCTERVVYACLMPDIRHRLRERKNLLQSDHSPRSCENRGCCLWLTHYLCRRMRSDLSSSRARSIPGDRQLENIAETDHSCRTRLTTKPGVSGLPELCPPLIRLIWFSILSFDFKIAVHDGRNSCESGLRPRLIPNS